MAVRLDSPERQQLRLAAGLAHVVPGAELRLRHADGRQVVVSRHPGADVDPCELRQAVAAGACPAHPDCSRWLEVDWLGGTLELRDHTVLRRHTTGREERWFATLLDADAVVGVLEGLTPDGLDEAAMQVISAGLRPDPVLEMTAVCLTTEAPCLEPHLDRIAAQAHAACLVAEITATIATQG